MLQAQPNKVMKGLPWVVIVCMLMGIGYMYMLSLPVSGKTAEPVIIKIDKGMSTVEIARLLREKGLISNTLYFRLMAKMQGLDNSMKAGEYTLDKSMSVGHIVNKLSQGEIQYQEFTIPEGYTIDQIAALLESRKLASADQFKALAANYTPFDYMNTQAPVTYKAEGFVFPDTYKVTVGSSAEDILKMMVAQFDQRFTPEMRQQAAAMGISVRDVIILASLVEREAKASEERPIIAGVFRNRLKIGMPLQSCATIQYILGYSKPELTIEDTKIASPYNTYQNNGLPPGPIANPGIASINAVLNSAKTDYLYFVADNKGKHYFSKTYEEHLVAIDKASH